MVVLVFDLDGTLYDSTNGYIENIRTNIFKFMYEQELISRDESAEEIWKPLFKKYNQSYKGLRQGGFIFDRDDYWRAHRSGHENYFTPNEKLAEMFELLPYKKVLFTNCREREAIELLTSLGIERYFDNIYGADFFQDYCKPDRETFDLLLNDLGVEANEIIFFEDSLKNLQVGHSLGMKTILIQGMTSQEETESKNDLIFEKPSYVDIIISTLTDGGIELKEKYPNLFLNIIN